LGIFGHRFAARNSRKTRADLDSEEIAAKDRTISVLKSSLNELEAIHVRENRAHARNSALEEKVTSNYLKDAEDGLIQKLPVKYEGSGWSSVITTAINSIPDGKIPMVNAETKGMVRGLVEANKEVVEEFAPVLLGAIVQLLPEESKAGLMKFLAPTLSEKQKEKGK